MSKSLKLKNNNYWDTKGIVHNKEKLDIVLENKQDEWQTIWEGSATTGNVIDTGVNFTNIKGIRFAWSRDKCWYEANIDHFLNKQTISMSYTGLAWGQLVQFYDTAITLTDVVAGKILVNKSSYCYKYTNDNSFQWNNNASSTITKVQIRY